LPFPTNQPNDQGSQQECRHPFQDLLTAKEGKEIQM
jgi:hypothetical protein